MIRMLQIIFIVGYGCTMTNYEVSEGPPWLLLIHQLPAKPAYARVKVWRRVQGLGGVAGEGGESRVCEAALVEGLSDRELQALFDAARDEDYRHIAAEARELVARLGDDLP